jgi:hypothetical protein
VGFLDTHATGLSQVFAQATFDFDRSVSLGAADKGVDTTGVLNTQDRLPEPRVSADSLAQGVHVLSFRGMDIVPLHTYFRQRRDNSQKPDRIGNS